MPEKEHADVIALIEKGDGVLTKRGGVWTYPGCPNDQSGSNVVMPAEFVTHAAVQSALSDGTLRSAVTSAAGEPISVRLADDQTPAVSAAMAGSPHAAGLKPEQDAGTPPIHSEEAAAIYEKAMAMTAEPAPAKSAAKRAPRT